MKKIKKFLKDNGATIVYVSCTITLTVIAMTATDKLDKTRKELLNSHMREMDLHNENLWLIQELNKD